MKLSILVPFYNSEKYIKDCLESILKLKIQDMEVLCLNDGSTDQSVEIVEQICSMDSRVRLINKDNSGYGDTLNRGINVAKGEYVGVVESDDLLIAEHLEELLLKADETDADIVKGNYNLYYDEDHKELFSNFESNLYDHLFKPEDNWRVLLSAPAIWSGIYKKSFLCENNIWLNPSPGASYQDTFFMFKTWICAKNAWISPKPIVNYRQTNEYSSSNSTRKIFDIFGETDWMKSFLVVSERKELLPICMRIKWESFAWNLSRLRGQARDLFCAKLYFDLKRDFYEGNFERKYWETENWNIVFNFLTDYRKVIWDNQGYSSDENVYDVLRLDKLTNIGLIEENSVAFCEKLQRKGIHVEQRYMIVEKKIYRLEESDCVELNRDDRDVLLLLDGANPKIGTVIGALEENHMHNYIVL